MGNPWMVLHTSMFVRRQQQLAAVHRSRKGGACCLSNPGCLLGVHAGKDLGLAAALGGHYYGCLLQQGPTILLAADGDALNRGSFLVVPHACEVAVMRAGKAWDRRVA